jgi:hypothetical protein
MRCTVPGWPACFVAACSGAKKDEALPPCRRSGKTEFNVGWSI